MRTPILLEKGIQWLKSNKGWCLYLLGVVVLAFTYELFNFSLSVDEELLATLTMPHTEWAAQGRWGMYFLSFLFLPNPMVPFSVLFFALLASAIAYTLVVRLFSDERGIEDYVIAPLFIACPILYQVYAFNTLSYGIGAGMLSATLAVYLFVTQVGKKKLWCLPFMAFALGIYQVFLFWMASLYLFHIFGKITLGRGESVKKVCKEGILFVGALGLGLALYHGIVQASYLLWPRSPYLEGMLLFTNDPATWWFRIVRGAKLLVATYTGFPEIYVFSLHLLGVAWCSAMATIFWQMAVKKGQKLLHLLGVVLLLIAIALPFTLNLFSQYILPLRILVGVPLAIAGVAYFACKLARSWVKVVLIVLMVIVGLHFSVINNRLAFSDALSWQRDRELTVRILSRIETLPYRNVHNGQPITVIGMYDQADPAPLMHYSPTSTVGLSFYGADGSANTSRVVGLMKTMGIDHFIKANIPQQQAIMDEVNSMPDWPAPGSVALVKGVVVVKFGSYQQNQIAPLCAGGEVKSAVCRITYNPKSGGIKLIDSSAIEKEKRKVVFSLEKNFEEMTIVNPDAVRGATQGSTEWTVLSQVMIQLPKVTVTEEEYGVLDLTITAEKEEVLFLFYQLPTDTNYGNGQEFHVRLDKGENRLSFVLPREVMEKPVRIDLSGAGSIYNIKEMLLSAVEK